MSSCSRKGTTRAPALLSDEATSFEHPYVTHPVQQSCRVTGEHAQDHYSWRADRFGVAALLLLIAPAVYLEIMWPGDGLGEPEILIAVLIALVSVAISSDWATRLRALARTLRAQPREQSRALQGVDRTTVDGAAKSTDW